MQRRRLAYYILQLVLGLFFLQTDLYNLFQQVKNNLLILYRLLTLLNFVLVQKDLKPKSLPSVRGFCKDCLLQKCI